MLEMHSSSIPVLFSPTAEKKQSDNKAHPRYRHCGLKSFCVCRFSLETRATCICVAKWLRSGMRLGHIHCAKRVNMSEHCRAKNAAIVFVSIKETAPAKYVRGMSMLNTETSFEGFILVIISKIYF